MKNKAFGAFLLVESALTVYKSAQRTDKAVNKAAEGHVVPLIKLLLFKGHS